MWENVAIRMASPIRKCAHKLHFTVSIAFDKTQKCNYFLMNEQQKLKENKWFCIRILELIRSSLDVNDRYYAYLLLAYILFDLLKWNYIYSKWMGKILNLNWNWCENYFIWIVSLFTNESEWETRYEIHYSSAFIIRLVVIQFNNSSK